MGQPHHTLIFAMEKEVELTTGVALPAELNDRVEQVFGRSASRVPAIKESVIRHLQKRVRDLEHENAELRAIRQTLTKIEDEDVTLCEMSPFNRHDSRTE